MAFVDEPILSHQWHARIEQARAHLARVAPHLTPAEREEIVLAYWTFGATCGIAPDGAFAQSLHETNSYQFGNQVQPRQHNPAGLGATNDGAAGIGWSTWREGIKAQFTHLLAWTGDPRGAGDARYSAVQAAAKADGYARTWRDLGGRWAWPGDGYGDGIERHWQALASERVGAMGKVARPAMDTDHRSPNSWPNDAEHPRQNQAIVWHITEGTSSLGWLTSEASQVSANYLIDRDGTIHELVDPHTDSAWANGPMKSPNTSNKLIALWYNGKINPNQRTISIEHEGFSSHNRGGALTLAQTKATIALTAWLCSEFGIAPDQDHILGHYEINDVDKHFCPGFSAAEWHTWVGQVAAIVNGAPATPPADENATPPAPAPADDDPRVDVTINDAGETVMTINFRGKAKAVKGFVVNDAGVTVEGEDGADYTRSIKVNFLPWVKH